MRKYIDAEQMKYQIRHHGVPDDYYDDEEREDIMCEMVDDLSAAEVVEIKHGKWLKQYRSSTKVNKGFVSSCCDMWNERKTPYCPHCGAKMHTTDNNSDDTASNIKSESMDRLIEILLPLAENARDSADDTSSAEKMNRVYNELLKLKRKINEI